jgi:hypothetical protein
MGVSQKVGFTRYPKQSDMVGKKAEICFSYDRSIIAIGTIVRSYDEEPYRVILQLADGRYLTDTECQYRLLTEK